MRVLYIDDSEYQRQLYTVYLENIIDNIEVFDESNTEAALLKLKKIPNLSLVLCANLKDGSIGGIYDYIRQNLPQVPFVLIGSDDPEGISALKGFKSHNEKNGHIRLPISPVHFRETILNLLCPSRFSMSVIPAFKKVRIIHFFRFNKVLCNVYIKLSDKKYVKVFNQNTSYSRLDLDKLLEKQVEFLFIRNDDFDKFHVTFSKTPFLVQTNTNTSDEDIAEVLETTQALMQRIIMNMGITKDVVDLAEGSIKQISDLVEKSQSILEILNRMRRDMNYLYDHSYLTAIVCCDILKQMRWNTEEKIKTLCMSALFHDMTLTNPDLAMIQDQNDIRLYHYTEEEIKQYLGHPFTAADILSGNEFVSTEVVDIVRQHHENHEGQGFPNKLHPSRLSSLTCVFIIAHEFVSEIFKYDFDPSSKSVIIEKMLPKYKSGHFKSPMNAFVREHLPELRI